MVVIYKKGTTGRHKYRKHIFSKIKWQIPTELSAYLQQLSNSLKRLSNCQLTTDQIVNNYLIISDYSHQQPQNNMSDRKNLKIYFYLHSYEFCDFYIQFVNIQIVFEFVINKKFFRYSESKNCFYFGTHTSVKIQVIIRP